MEQAMQISALPLVNSKTVIIERGLVVIKRTSIRPKFGDVHGREVKKLSELPFALPNLRFRLLCVGDIHRGPNKFFEVARLVQDRMADNMEVLDGTVGKNNAVVCLIIGLLPFASFKHLLNGPSVLRMNPVKPKFSGRHIVIRTAAEDSMDLRRDCDCPRCNIMSPAARMAESLRLKQTFFTAAQLLICFLAFVNIRNQVVPTDDAPFRVPQRPAAYLEPAVNTIGAPDTVLNLVRIPRLYGTRPLKHHALAIIRMHKRAPITQFLTRLARVIQELLIDEFDLASRGHRTHQAGNAVDD